MTKMKCPHCGSEMNLFSKEMSIVTRTKACPACGKGVKLSLVLLNFALVFLPVAVFGIFVTRNTPLSCGMAAAVATCMGLRLKVA